MKFPFLASFIVFIIWLKYELGKSNKKNVNAESDFWENEQRANEVRKKPLNDLDYIALPKDILPYDILAEHPDIVSAREKISSLSDKKIVNLTGFTNTELKLAYGTANITPLTEYDDNYALLVSQIQIWANVLCENGYEEAAVPMLEFAIETGSDVRGSYALLLAYYRAHGNTASISHLKEKAQALNSLSKDSILRLLSSDSQTD